MCDGPISGSVVDGVEFSAQNGTVMSGIRFALAALMCFALVPSAFAGHTLTTPEPENPGRQVAPVPVTVSYQVEGAPGSSSAAAEGPGRVLRSWRVPRCRGSCAHNH